MASPKLALNPSNTVSLLTGTSVELRELLGAMATGTYPAKSHYKNKSMVMGNDKNTKYSSHLLVQDCF